MAIVNLKTLIQKLGPHCERSLETAVGMCLSRSHYTVEIAHWLIRLVEITDGDLAFLLPHYQIAASSLLADLQQYLERQKTGNSQSPVLSQWLVDWIQEAWLLASVEFNAKQIRSGHLLYALLQATNLAQVTLTLSPQLKKLNLEDFRKNLTEITLKSVEVETISAPLTEGALIANSSNAKTQFLDQFTIDLTAQARQGKIDEVIGREMEIRQVIDILTRKRQNNPILTGEPGVGKTAVVEGFALRVARGEVPSALQNVALRILDLGLLQAGAGIRGEFENRLKSVINEVKASAQPIVLFIDEAHTLVGAGAQAGQGDAANLLKPALARGELRTIAATTWAEYKKYFEQDAALARRFQVIKVEEPTEAVAISMLRGLVAAMEKHHQVRVLDEAISAAVELSHRYITGRQLPDKAISVLDTACARLAIRAIAQPPVIADLQQQLNYLVAEIELLQREQALGLSHIKKLKALAKQQQQLKNELSKLQQRWQQEKDLVQQIRAVRSQFNVPTSEQNRPNKKAVKQANLLKQLQRLQHQLQKLQNDNPLLQDCVNAQTIAEVIASWTGIPVGRMKSGDIKAVAYLQERLKQRIVGQDYALKSVSQRIQMARVQLTDPRKPIGVFLFIGPSGVGKTETALALAEQLYGGEQNLTVINLSEFKEEHKVSLLLGSPPGYVGYGEGGILTEAVRRNPYSLVLLDEIEKAHIGVQDIFYQVFDKGILKDGQGRDIDFKNTVIILTSNVGSDLISQLCAEPAIMPAMDELIEMLKPELLKFFKSAFLGRVTIVPYLALDKALLQQIIELQLSYITQRIASNYQAQVTFETAIVEQIASYCSQSDTGARAIENLLAQKLLPMLAEHFLMQMAETKTIKTVSISLDSDGQFSLNY